MENAKMQKFHAARLSSELTKDQVQDSSHIVVRILQIVYVAGFVARDPRFSSVEAGGDARDPVGVRKS